jgi:RHS repeat-associated protein
MSGQEKGGASVMMRNAVYLTLCVLLCAVGTAQAATTVTTISYDAGDHVTRVTDPRGLVTTYAYDGLGQLWQQVSPDTGTTSFDYDSYGHRTSMTRADGTQTTYGYDSLNRMISVSAGGQTQTFAYDSCTNGIGRLCSDSDGTGSVSYAYSPQGWVTNRAFSISGTTYQLAYSYDDMGRTQTVTYPDGNQATYSYADGTVSSVALKVGGSSVMGASNVTYRPGNLEMAGWTSGNGLINTLSYDSDGRLTGISVPTVEDLSFAYDKADRITSITNGIDSSQSQSFTYDDHSRLTSATGLAESESYTYDADGNRASQTVNGSVTNFSIGSSSNRLLGMSGAVSHGYGYDAQGNTTTVDGATSNQYNAFNRLSSSDGASDYVSPEGQRLRKVSGTGATTYFAPQDAALFAENDDGVWVDYVWLNGRLIGRVSGGSAYAISDDQMGRPQIVTDSSGGVVWSASNNAFGRQVTVDDIGGLNIGFPGQYYDAGRGTWNNGYRDYNAVVGRYMESDPMGLISGINTYAYVASNPLSLIDPLGLNFFGKCLAQSYLKKYGKDAWRHAKHDRVVNAGPVYPGTPQEALRNAEHYLYAYESAEEGQWAVTAGILSVGYAGYKVMRNTFQGSSSPYRDDYPSMSEVRSGIEGNIDGKNGGGAASSCGCSGP